MEEERRPNYPDLTSAWDNNGELMQTFWQRALHGFSRCSGLKTSAFGLLWKSNSTPAKFRESGLQAVSVGWLELQARPCDPMEIEM